MCVPLSGVSHVVSSVCELVTWTMLLHLLSGCYKTYSFTCEQGENKVWRKKKKPSSVFDFAVVLDKTANPPSKSIFKIK